MITQAFNDYFYQDSYQLTEDFKAHHTVYPNFWVLYNIGPLKLYGYVSSSFLELISHI
jgi:hypothetical protein